MTVAELIALLQGMPQGLRVMLDDDRHGVYGPAPFEVVAACKYSDTAQLRPGAEDEDIVLLAHYASSYPQGLPGGVRIPVAEAA